MYYGLAEPVINAGPRNAHRRPLIPPLAILFSSLLGPAPCRALSLRGPPSVPSRSPAPPPLSEALFLHFSSSVSALRERVTTRAHSVIIIGSRTACAARTSFPLSFFRLSPLTRLFVRPSVRSFLHSFVCACIPSRVPPEFHYAPLRIDLRDAPTSPTGQIRRDLLPRRARARANIRQCANLPATRRRRRSTRVYILSPISRSREPISCLVLSVRARQLAFRSLEKSSRVENSRRASLEV